MPSPEKSLLKSPEKSSITPEKAAVFSSKAEQVKKELDDASTELRGAIKLTTEIANALAKDPTNAKLLSYLPRMEKVNQKANAKFQLVNQSYQAALGELGGEEAESEEGPMSTDEVLARISQGGTPEERLAFLAELKRRGLEESTTEELSVPQELTPVEFAPSAKALSPYLDAATIHAVADFFDASGVDSKDLEGIFRRMQVKESRDGAVYDLFISMYSGVEQIERRGDKGPIDPAELTKRVEALLSHLKMRYGVSAEAFTDAVNLFNGMPPRGVAEFVKTGRRGIQWPGIYVIEDGRKRVVIPVRVGTETNAKPTTIEKAKKSIEVGPSPYNSFRTLADEVRPLIAQLEAPYNPTLAAKMNGQIDTALIQIADCERSYSQDADKIASSIPGVVYYFDKMMQEKMEPALRIKLSPLLEGAVAEILKSQGMEQTFKVGDGLPRDFKDEKDMRLRIARVVEDENNAGKIVAIIQRGFRKGERIVSSAEVVYSDPASAKWA